MPNSLTIGDNRTGQSCEIRIENGSIRAADLGQIEVDDADFGLVSYDPALANTAV